MNGSGFTPGDLITLRFFSGSGHFPVSGGEGIGVAEDGSFRVTLGIPDAARAQCGMRDDIGAFVNPGPYWAQESPEAGGAVAFPCG